MASGKIFRLVALLIIAGICFNGTTTSNGFIYKPALGARGATEQGLFDAGLDRVDTRLAKEIWLGDPNYGSTLSATVTAIGSNQVILRVPAGTHSIGADLTIPTNVTLKPERGAILSIATTKTLTINGSLAAGLYQIFSCIGTGKVVLGAGVVKEVYPQWWGATGDGITDDLIPITTAIIAANTTGVYSIVRVIEGNYALSNSLPIYSKVQIVGNGAGTVFKPTGNYPAFASTEKLGETSSLRFNYVLKNCTIDSSANANEIYHIDFGQFGVVHRCLSGINFVGNPAALQGAIKHTTDLSCVFYNNLIQNCSFSNITAKTGILWFIVNATSLSSVNSLEIRNFTVTGSFNRFLNIEAAKYLKVTDGTFYQRISDPVLSDGSNGKNFYITIGKEGISEASKENSISNVWFEEASTAVVICEHDNTTIYNGISVSRCQNLSTLGQVWRPQNITDRYWTATRTSANTCTLAGDKTTLLKSGYKVFFVDTDGTWYNSSLASDSTYNGGTGLTTVTINDARFTANLLTLYRAADYNSTNPPRQELVYQGSHSLYKVNTPEVNASQNVTVAEGGKLNVGKETVVTATINTTGATVGTLYSATLPEGYSWYYEANIVAWQTGGAAGTIGDSAAYKRICGAKRLTGGAAALVGAVVDSGTMEDAAAAGWDVTFNVSANLLRLRVTGEADKNITWYATIKAVKSGN